MPAHRHTIMPIASLALFAGIVLSTPAIAQPQARPEATAASAPSAAEPQASESSAPAIEPLSQDWTIRFEPYVGYIGPAGDLRLPSDTTRGGEFTLEDLNLDSTRVLPIGRIQAQRGKWRFGFSGLGFDANDQSSQQTTAGQIGGVAFAAGDELVSDLSYQSFDLLVSYRVWNHTADTNANNRVRLDVGLDVIGGLRFHNASIDIRNRPATAPAPGTPLIADADEFFAEPVAGLRLDLTIVEKFGVEVETLAGGFSTGDRSSGSFSIDAGFAYRPMRSIGIKIGYRLLVFGLNDGEGNEEFDWAGSMAGLYFGAQISF